MANAAKRTTLFLMAILMTAILIVLFAVIKNNLIKKNIQDTFVNNELVVILDAGHGGEDGGAVGYNNVYEKDINLNITLKIGKRLENSGIKVVYTRTDDRLLYDKNSDYKNKKKSLDLLSRLKIAEETDNCIFVSIHMNSFSQPSSKGLQIYYSRNNPDSFVLAQTIQNAVRENLQPGNRRKIMEATSRIYLLHRIKSPAILIECGFLSNREECNLLTTEIYQNQLSETIAEEIKNYIEKKLKYY